MNREQGFFLQVIADHLHGRETAPPEKLDWVMIASYTKSHEMEGILAHQCAEYLKSQPQLKDVRERLEKAKVSSLFYYFNRVQMFEEIKNAFRSKQFRFFSVKGLNIAEMYPIPAFRTMGDIDIVMSGEDRERAREPMTRMGFQLKPGGYERSYSKPGLSIELHDRLIYKENLEAEARINYFNACWEHVASEENGWCQLDWNFHFLFLIEHLKLHFGNNGVGFRQFTDIVVTGNRQSLDWDWIETELRKIGLWEFTCTVYAFCERWWGIVPPMPVDKPDEAFFEVSTDMVFRNGVFGHDNDDHEKHSVGKQLNSIKTMKPLRNIVVALRNVFEPYNRMVSHPYCAFLIGHKWLLPAAWVYRVIYIGIHKKGRIREKFNAVFQSSDVIARHNKLLERWGL